jgi:hypothetical protein
MCANPSSSTTPPAPEKEHATISTTVQAEQHARCAFCGKNYQTKQKNSPWCNDCEKQILNSVPSDVLTLQPESAFDFVKQMCMRLLPNATEDDCKIIDDEIAKAKSESNLGKSKAPPVIRMEDLEQDHDNEDEDEKK